MEEFFPFDEFKKIGFFTDEMKGDYEAQAKKVCDYFNFDSVYEYGAMNVRAHITYGSSDEESGLETNRPLYVDGDGKLKEESFITEIKSIYE